MKINLCRITTLCFILVIIPAQAVVNIGSLVIYKENTIEVLGPGPDLQAIIDSILDESVSNPYLIKLSAGRYPIANNPVAPGIQMTPYISIQGSGEGVTILKGEAGSAGLAATSAIVAGAKNVSLTDLSIENTGNNTYSIGIFNSDASPRIENVTSTASGGINNYGVYNKSSAFPVITHVEATGSGGTSSTGIHNESSSVPTLTHVVAKASGGSSTNYGVRNIQAPAKMLYVTATGSGGASNYGVYNEQSANPTMIHVTATGSGGTSNIGIRTDFSVTARIDFSVITGSSAGIDLLNSLGSRITNSRIVGGIANNGTGTQCRDNYDENLNAVNC